jgi:hypothetical protein
MSRNLLMQSVLGHLALLAEKHPKKAASAVAKRARRYARLTLNQQQQLLLPQNRLPLRKAA